MKKPYLKLLALSVLVTPYAVAEIQFNGFGSVRATYSESDNGSAPFSYLDEGDITFKGESLFALQARADLGEGLSATVQMFAEGRDDFDIEARWAYVSYQLDDTHQINAGKLANPIFHQSEYEKVGYAHNFSRLPVAVYSGFDFATMEGISLNSQFELADGDYTLDTKLSYGNWEGTVFLAAAGGDVPLGLDNIFSFNATLSGDWWKVFAGAFITEMNATGLDQGVIFPFAQPGIDLATSLGATSSDINELTSSLAWHEKDGLYWFSGFGFDYNNFIVDFEYANYAVDDAADAPNEAWYIAFGYRFGDYVVTIHTEEQTQDIEYDFLDNVQHPVLQATGRGIVDALGAVEFEGSGISLRYDFHPSAAFKLDYFSGENTRADIGDYTIVSAGIDVVF
ncbi:hypothetical protein HII17_14920 [Thalassotalea sp. M1531]|uniref:Porin n=1 Tax=Thalassotalea algicola TaxID=2716224 RepID=A0A7Y0LET3_9GAMM|nr:hypothetical protein [Thalassotalea algicola]NMP32847.1 hypothetical protein [Thalassotalea algicola]